MREIATWDREIAIFDLMPEGHPLFLFSVGERTTASVQRTRAIYTHMGDARFAVFCIKVVLLIDRLG